MANNEETFNTLTPQLDGLFRELKAKISDQKVENEKI